MRSTRRLFVATSSLLAVLSLTAAALAEDWPGWRGPRGDGTSTETGVPLKWSQTENIVWKTPIPGKGHSSPVIWGDRIFVSSSVDDQQKQQLLCLERTTGKVIWTQEQSFKKQLKIHKLNSHASSTPATDGKYVYFTFHDQPHFVVCCYDFNGKLVWKKSPGDFYSVHGFCSAPVLYKDTLLLNGDQDKKSAYLVALDKATGDEKWRAARPGVRSYCPPVVFDIHGKKQLVIAGSNCVASYDPDNGKQIWIIDGPTEQYVASLVYRNDILFMTYGFPLRGVMGINPDGQGNVTNTHVLYNDSPGSGGYVPSPIAHGDYFFNFSDEGFGTCREGKTGKLLWRERMGRHISASPVSSGDYLFIPDDDGKTWVLKAGPTYELVHKNEIGEEVYASLAISRGQIFLRGLNNLYCIGTTNKANGGR
jgi:outer membrane protein assembly factor BamB